MCDCVCAIVCVRVSANGYFNMCMRISLYACVNVCVCISVLLVVCLYSFSSLGKAGCTWPLIISTEPEFEKVTLSE